MFRNAFTKIKEVLTKMGIIKEIKKISDIRDINIDEKYYSLIDDWFAIYGGYFPKWHDKVIQTIGGTRKETSLTLNMAKVVANDMASLVFNERCEINVSDNGLNDFIQEVLRDNKFITNMQNNLEFGFAVGGMVLKPYVDNNEVKISYVTADAFIPISWDNRKINEAVFPFETTKGKYKYTHLEWHLWEMFDVDGERKKKYVIKNELYRIEKGQSGIGIKVALNELFDDIEEKVVIDDVENPLFVYIKPNTANHIDHKSPLGVPIFSHALDTVRLLDVAFDSYFREFKLGKRRIIVPATAVQTVVDENGNMVRYFDANDEVYQAMDLGNMDNQKITDNTVEIRVEEHIKAINSLLNILAVQTGFSSGTWSFDGTGGVKTATEVVSENSRTFKTKQSHEILVEDGLSSLVDVIHTLAVLYDIYPKVENYETSVMFDDSIAEDRTAEVTRETELVNNKLQSKVRALMNIHGITRPEAEELLKEINEENTSVGGGEIDFFGLNRQNLPNIPPQQQSAEENKEEDEEA